MSFDNVDSERVRKLLCDLPQPLRRDRHLRVLPAVPIDAMKEEQSERLCTQSTQSVGGLESLA
jgi:hypothetical protein